MAVTDYEVALARELKEEIDKAVFYAFEGNREQAEHHLAYVSKRVRDVLNGERGREKR